MEFEYDPFTREYMFKDTDFVKKYSYTDVINPDYTQIKEHCEEMQKITKRQSEMLFYGLGRNYYEETEPYEEIEPYIVVYRSKPIKRNNFRINREKP